ncbi:large ribosomal RNA subunit accumulation protein YCED homolog 1, chloroplastic [Primulina huaijiensis]|uniref:large ribosomal RNA subunit accumulation protein YCED homolog 1, chloroplastic n=1 Tax=Primulina huaijiensis TaxID=1492673 RepID=UPI003CC772DF
MLAPSATSSAAVPLPSFPLTQFSFRKIFKPFNTIHPTYQFQKKPSNLVLAKPNTTSSFHFTSDAENPSFTEDYQWDLSNEGIEESDDEGCSWEGAVMYRRNAAVSHLEYCTTLERLGLGKISSEVSKARASEMGLRVVNSVKDYPNGTPVLVSVDVTRKKQKLRLDGIVRTVISLPCNRCGEPAAQSVYSDFSLLLCEEPIQEPETINMGTIFAEDKFRTLITSEEAEDDDDDSLIDLDDQLYFPPDRKIIDISKNLRDLIHVEITISALCDPSCKGACLRCGTNLNISSCSCKTQQVGEKGYGPLGDLREKMQKK